MKTADVVIGATYLTRVGGSLVRVVVVRKENPLAFSTLRRRQVRFTVRRVGEERVLPKTRTASALRPAPERKQTSAAEDTARLVDYTDGGLEYAAEQARKRAAE